MIIYEKYTGTKTYMAPSGAIMDPETVYKQWPAAKSFTFVVGTDEAGEVMASMDNLSNLRTIYEIDKSLSVDEAIAKLQEIRNTPPPEPAPSAEERMAAAMEFQNMLAMTSVANEE